MKIFTNFPTPVTLTETMTEAVCFYVFSALMLLAALLVVFSRQPVYSVLSLLVVMFCLAALFVMLGAYFVAGLQVLLYAGAVLVLFLFVLMLLNLEQDVLARAKRFTLGGAGALAALLLLAALLRIVQSSGPAAPAARLVPPAGTVESVGRLLFTAYLLPFELTSFLILAAIIGAVTLAKQRPRA